MLNSQKLIQQKLTFFSTSKKAKNFFLTLFRIGLCGAARGWVGEKAKKPSLPKFCHTYPTMMKLGTIIPCLKNTQQYESHDTPPEFCWHQHFFTRNQKILKYYKIQIQILFWHIISNSFNVFLVLKTVLIDMVTILMMAAKWLL